MQFERVKLSSCCYEFLHAPFLLPYRSSVPLAYSCRNSFAQLEKYCGSYYNDFRLRPGGLIDSEHPAVEVG